MTALRTALAALVGLFASHPGTRVRRTPLGIFPGAASELVPGPAYRHPSPKDAT